MEALIGHKGNTKYDREFLVKWIQYAKAESTWEPRSELMRRCEDEVLAYELNHPLTVTLTRRVVPKPKAKSNEHATPNTKIVTKRVPPAEVPSLPIGAKYERGKWWYETTKAIHHEVLCGVGWRPLCSVRRSKLVKPTRTYA